MQIAALVNKQKRKAVILLPTTAHIFVILQLIHTLVRGWEPERLGFILLNYSFNNYLLHAFKCARHRKANTLLLKCITREGKRLSEDLKAMVKKLALRNYLNGWVIPMDSQGPQRGSCNNLRLHWNCWLHLCSHVTGWPGGYLSTYAGQRWRSSRSVSLLLPVNKPDLSFYLAGKRCISIFGVDPSFVGPELLQFQRPFPRKRIQNYDYSIKYAREYLFGMRKDIKTNY